jgi:GTP-binding protein
MQVNPARSKKLSNVRSKQADEKVFVPPPRALSLEESIGYIQPDEMIEVTPNAIRLRKATLGKGERKKKQSSG